MALRNGCYQEITWGHDQPGRLRKPAPRVTRTETQNPHLTVEELQGGVKHSWSWFTVELFSNTCTKKSQGKLTLCPHHTIQHQKFAKQHLDRPDAFCKQVEWWSTNRICRSQWAEVCLEKKGHIIQWKSVQLLSKSIDPPCFMVVFQP